jgi:hypothetical protein
MIGRAIPSPAMRRLLIVAMSATTLAAALDMPAGAGARTYMPDCQSKLRYQPRSVTVFCADGGMRVRRIDWTSWGDDRARGDSRRAFANDCQPSCAEGTIHRYRVRLLLRRVERCPSGKRAFTRMRVTFVGRKWPGPRTFTNKLFCPE